MKRSFYQLILLSLIISSLFTECTPRTKYEMKLKHELKTGIRYDSLFMGLYFGMSQKEFYTHCWQLNRQGIVRQGPGNTTVEYQIREELKHPAIMNFYPGFVEGRIAEMPVKFTYSGWAPWNLAMSADSLQIDLLQWFEKMYGNEFMKIDHPERGAAYVKLNGNRRITIFQENSMNVWAIFTDMSVERVKNDTSGAGYYPADAPEILK